MSYIRSAFPTMEEIKKVINEHSYIRVSGNRGSKNMSITNAVNFLKEHPDYVYVPALHIMGTPQDVYNAVLSLKTTGPNGQVVPYFTEEEARQFATIAANNPNNYNALNIQVPESQGGVGERFLKEVEEAKIGRKAIKEEKEKTKKPKASLEELSAIYYTVFGKKSPINKSPKKKGGLVERYMELAPDKVLDVSNYNPSTGYGAETANIPGPKSTKILVPGTKLISNNPNTLAAAAGVIFGPEQAAKVMELYNNTILAKYGGLNNMPQQAPQPVAQQMFTSPSPQRQVTPPQQPVIQPSVQQMFTSPSPQRQVTPPQQPVIQPSVQQNNVAQGLQNLMEAQSRFRSIIPNSNNEIGGFL